MYTPCVVFSLVALPIHFVIALPPPLQDKLHVNHQESTVLADGISINETADTFPPRDLANITKFYGTSLYGFDKCDELNPNYERWIKEAYNDTNRLANQDGVKNGIDWESHAAFEFLGPTALNKDQQPQIQAVLANIATVKDDSLRTSNWIHVRCDDPIRRCSTGQPQFEIPLTYSRNPHENDNGGMYPYINFCPEFFELRSLDDAMGRGSGYVNPTDKYNLENYESRASAFLRELLHIDSAANSVNGAPNPRIYDVKIRVYPNDGNQGWVNANGIKLSKLLASYYPRFAVSTPTGYFVQRNAGNFVGFTLAKYVERVLGHYPFLPAVYNRVREAPWVPYTRYSINSTNVRSVDQTTLVTSDDNLVTSPSFSSVEREYSAIQSTDERALGDLELR